MEGAPSSSEESQSSSCHEEVEEASCGQSCESSFGGVSSSQDHVEETAGEFHSFGFSRPGSADEAPRLLARRSFEEMLYALAAAHGAQVGDRRPTWDPVGLASFYPGLSDEEIQAIPQLSFDDVQSCLDNPMQPPTCSICLEGFVAGEHLSRPWCQHIFHSACLKEWFHRASRCPLCRAPCGRRVK
mmetsp:Transcript_43406/g.100037  ORF Transcript_43406/g.100037 Transcript_43406/m.100037 type:complete len:186 (-) Transcript_43406:200-757(-)